VKGECTLHFADLAAYSEGQLFIVMADTEPFGADEFVLRKLSSLAPDRVWLGANCLFDGRDRRRLTCWPILPDGSVCL
jgi:error-prone DNA polymerase